MDEELEELKRMIRHLHNDVELLKRNNHIAWHRFTGIVYALGDKLEIDEKIVDDIVNVDIDVYKEADNTYTPIDEIDKKDWISYKLKEKIE